MDAPILARARTLHAHLGRDLRRRFADVAVDVSEVDRDALERLAVALLELPTSVVAMLGIEGPLGVELRTIDAVRDACARLEQLAEGDDPDVTTEAELLDRFEADLDDDERDELEAGAVLAGHLGAVPAELARAAPGWPFAGVQSVGERVDEAKAAIVAAGFATPEELEGLQIDEGPIYPVPTDGAAVLAEAGRWLTRRTGTATAHRLLLSEIREARDELE